MPKGGTGVPKRMSSSVSSTAQKGRKRPAVVALDSYDSILRIAVGNSLRNISFSERPNELSFEELELNGQRLNSYRVLVTDESRNEIASMAKFGIVAERLPRILAIYWSFNNEPSEQPYLVFSLGLELAMGGLVVDGTLDRQEVNNSALSLRGIWEGFVAGNSLLRKLIGSYAQREPTFYEQAFQSFLSVLRTGEKASIGPIAFVPPFDFSDSLDPLLRFLRSVDPDGLANGIILSDWAANNSNLPELLSQIYADVHRPPSEESFLQAARGLVAYSLSGSPLETSKLNFSPKEVFFQNVPVGGAAESTLALRNAGAGVLRVKLTSSEPWLRLIPGYVVCRRGQEQVVSIHFEAKGLGANQTYAGRIQMDSLGSGLVSKTTIQVTAKTLAQLPVPIKEPSSKKPPSIANLTPSNLVTTTRGEDVELLKQSDEKLLKPAPVSVKSESLEQGNGRAFSRLPEKDSHTFGIHDLPSRSESYSRRPIFLAIGVTVLAIMIPSILWGVWSSKTRDTGGNPASENKTTAPTQTPNAPVGMTYVNGGTFMMGNNQGDEYERPAHSVPVRSFFIDVYEVTCEDYEKFLKATGNKPPQGWTNGSYRLGAGREPVTGVDWFDATAYAAWIQKRLPTEAEWEFAARGTTGWRYPWGNSWKPNTANAADSSAGHLVEVGSFPNGVRNELKVFDMIGNAWEWTASNLTAYPGGQIPTPEHGNLKIIRGGSWQSDQSSATTTYRWGWPASGGKDYSNTGFRCVRDVP